MKHTNTYKLKKLEERTENGENQILNRLTLLELGGGLVVLYPAIFEN